MPRIPGIRRSFREAELANPEREVDDELRFHFDMRIQELLARGMSPEAARAEAVRAFGDVTRVRAGLRQIDREMRQSARRADRWGDLWRNVRHSLRGLARQPGFAAVVVLMLALGVGANVTMFGIIDRLLLRPPAHIVRPDEVHRLYFKMVRGGEDQLDNNASYPQYLAVVRAMRSAAGVAAYISGTPTVGEEEAAHPAPAVMATASFFPTLGVRPALGRFFTAEEDVPPNGVKSAVIGYELWQREYGGRRDVLGHNLVIEGDRYQIVGVAPRGFTGVDIDRVDVWVPLAAMAGHIITASLVPDPWYRARQVGWLKAVARVPSHVSMARATSEAAAGLRQSLEERWSAARADSMRPRASLEPLLEERGPDRSSNSKIALWLGGMAAVVLLIACANVANLLLARALRRRREIALRVALGAGRGRLIAQLLTEGMILALLGGAGAVLVAQLVGGLVRGTLLSGVEFRSTLADPRSLLFALMAAIVAGLLTGLVPAMQANELDLVGSLKTGVREGGTRRSFTRNALVVVQAALSLILLVAAGLFLRSLQRARNVDLGYSAQRVYTVSPDFTSVGYSEEQAKALYDQLLERIARIPGVQSASEGMTAPFMTALDTKIGLPGRDSVQMPPTGEPRFNAVTPEYFTTMGTKLLRGRAFTASERTGGAPVVIVSQTTARWLWPAAEAIGKCVILLDEKGKPCVEVIGVAQDVRWQVLDADPVLQMYLPLTRDVGGISLRVVYVRSGAEPVTLARAVQQVVRELAPQVPFVPVHTIADNIEPKLRPWKLGATMFTLFGALALVLASVGLYSVIAYSVQERTREMGVRLALGASAGNVLRLIVGQGVRVAVVGIVIGALVSLSLGRFFGTLLFATSPNDPLVLGLVIGLLFAIAIAASLIPAWRATRVAPGVALRSE